MSYKDYAMMINPLVYNPFLDQIVHFQRELPLPDRSFWLETVKLRGAGEEPEEIILVNHIPTLWIDKNVPLILDDLSHPTLHITSRLAHLVLIENVYNGPDMIIDGNFFPFFWRHGQRIVTVGPGRNDRRPGDKGLLTKSLAYQRDESYD